MNKKDFERIVRIINKLEYMGNRYEHDEKILGSDDIKIFGEYWQWEHYIDFGYFIKRELYCDFSYFADIVNKNDYDVVKEFVTEYSLNFDILCYEVCSDGQSAKNKVFDLIKNFKETKNINIEELNKVFDVVGYCQQALDYIFLLDDDLLNVVIALKDKRCEFLNGINVISKYVRFNYELI